MKRHRIILQGDVPSPLNPPPGCRFHTRCPYARERCRAETPGLDDDGKGHKTACHFWPEIAPSRELVPAATARADTRLARLQSFFTRRSRDGTDERTGSSHR